MNMTDILLTVSVGCNLWFLFLLLYDRIMETRFVRFLKGIAGLWRSLGATSEKGIELSEEEATFDDGNTETVSRPAQVPEEKLDETFTSIPPSELEFGEDEPEDGTPDTPRATGSSFDEIDDAVRAAKNPEATTAERERAAKVFSDMEGTELYEKLMSGSTELSIRIKGLIEVRLKKPKKEFTVPDNIDEFNIRDYV